MSWLGSLTSSIGSGLSSVGSAIGSAASSAGNAIGSGVSSVGNAVGNAASNFNLGDTMKNIGSGIKNPDVMGNLDKGEYGKALGGYLASSRPMVQMPQANIPMMPVNSQQPDPMEAYRRRYGGR